MTAELVTAELSLLYVLTLKKRGFFSTQYIYNLKVGCLHTFACTRSGSGFPSNVTLV
jgi:hypothetical protein